MSSNKTTMRITEVCADCGSLDPSWALVNRGLLVCDECCSVHRSLGRHISQVKSLKKSHWCTSQLTMVTTLNSSGVNNLWEHSLLDLKRRKPTSKDLVHPIKEEFIKQKHQMLAFIPRSEDSTEEELSQSLHSSVRTGNLETSLRLLSQGADPNYYHPEKGNRTLHVASKAGQMGQVELLLAHGANPSSRDSSGNTPAQCASQGGHREVGLRLIEALYEVTDRLTYFLCRMRPDHSQGVHLVLPCPADCIVKPRHSSSNDDHSTSLLRISQLTNSQLEDLAMDLYDEVDRRETESIWCQSGASLEHGSVPFLPVNPGLSSMRNQGRQKLATCSEHEFSALLLDLLTEAKRRHTLTINERSSMKPGQKELDDEPLYDSVASDDDYATAEQLAILVAQNAKGLPLSICDVGTKSTEKELKEKIAASEAKANMFATQNRLLNAKIDELSSENRQLKMTLKKSMLSSGSGSSSCNSNLGMTTGPQSLGSEIESSVLGVGNLGLESGNRGSQRPASMYEQRDNIQLVIGSGTRMPSSDEVMKRSAELTKRIRDLWGSMRTQQNPTQHHASAQGIRDAVQRLASIFPQKPSDEIVASALMQLSTSTMKLEAYYSDLERATEQVRATAFTLANATKQIVTRFQYPRDNQLS